MPEKKLDQAYDSKTPSENLALYEDWSETYDQDFVEDKGYIAPREIARLFVDRFDRSGSVLDVGTGTGALGNYLDGMVVDGVDISPKMLEQAQTKRRYRNLIAADLTTQLPIADEQYAGFVSSGTFTHGHVGPGCFQELLRIARPGALFCLGTITSVFDQAGFGSALARLVSHRRIAPVTFEEISIYENVNHDHKDDMAFAAIFVKI